MTKSFYQKWNQMEHITKFAKRLDDEMTYLNTHDGIEITEANKLQFYTEQMLDSTYFDKSTIMKWEKRDPSRKTWAKATSYFEKWTRREEKYDISAGGTAKKTRFESNQQVREHQPAQEQRDDSDNIGTDNALREYIDSASAASMAKEERILQMAEDARRKDDQYEAMLERLDAKDKQMNDLILQVAAINSNNQTNNVEPHQPRNPKRKAEETDANTGTGSGANGEWIKEKYKWKGQKRWTDPAEFGFPKSTKD